MPCFDERGLMQKKVCVGGNDALLLLARSGTTCCPWHLKDFRWCKPTSQMPRR